jgi:hypothetical protein
MLVTGWDWPTLAATPGEIVDEVILFHQAQAEEED